MKVLAQYENVVLWLDTHNTNRLKSITKNKIQMPFFLLPRKVPVQLTGDRACNKGPLHDCSVLQGWAEPLKSVYSCQRAHWRVNPSNLVQADCFLAGKQQDSGEWNWWGLANHWKKPYQVGSIYDSLNKKQAIWRQLGAQTVHQIHSSHSISSLRGLIINFQQEGKPTTNYYF